MPSIPATPSPHAAPARTPRRSAERPAAEIPAPLGASAAPPPISREELDARFLVADARHETRFVDLSHKIAAVADSVAAMREDQRLLHKDLKADQQALRLELQTDQRSLRLELQADHKALKQELHDEHKALRQELQDTHKTLRQDLQTDNDAVRRDVNGANVTTRWTVIGVGVTVVGLVIGLMAYGGDQRAAGAQTAQDLAATNIRVSALESRSANGAAAAAQRPASAPPTIHKTPHP